MSDADVGGSAIVREMDIIYETRLVFVGVEVKSSVEECQDISSDRRLTLSGETVAKRL